jgi:hypothetical protein
MDEGVGTYPKDLDWAKQVVPRLRTLSADKRIEQLPAKFLWTMLAAADEIERLRIVCETYAQSSAAACREIAGLRAQLPRS